MFLHWVVGYAFHDLHLLSFGHQIGCGFRRWFDSVSVSIDVVNGTIWLFDVDGHRFGFDILHRVGTVDNRSELVYRIIVGFAFAAEVNLVSSFDFSLSLFRRRLTTLRFYRSFGVLNRDCVLVIAFESHCF